MGPPTLIYQCGSGHLVCDTCRPGIEVSQKTSIRFTRQIAPHVRFLKAPAEAKTPGPNKMAILEIWFSPNTFPWVGKLLCPRPRFLGRQPPGQKTKS